MASPAFLRILRDVTAIIVVAAFMFPLFWWGLMSIKPASATFDIQRVIWFDFVPTYENYALTLGNSEPGVLASQQAVFDSIAVATGATLLTLVVGLAASFALSLIPFKRRRHYFIWVLFQRVVPPIAIILPLVFMYHRVGINDTRTGVIFAHTTLNLPFAILLLKSFFDDVPREVGEAAEIDGATRFEVFALIFVPMIRGGIAATAVLCFIFSWTEFMMALFLTDSIRLLPIQLSILVSSTWGFTAALSTFSILPGFVFILLVQKHLVRGLTMGLTKG